MGDPLLLRARDWSRPYPAFVDAGRDIASGPDEPFIASTSGDPEAAARVIRERRLKSFPADLVMIRPNRLTVWRRGMLRTAAEADKTLGLAARLERPVRNVYR